MTRSRILLSLAVTLASVLAIVGLNVLTDSTTPEPELAAAKQSPASAPTASGSSAPVKSPAKSPAAATSASPGPAPIKIRQKVPLTSTASFGDGVTAKVSSIRAIKADGQGGIGDVAGPAVAVSINLRNGTADTISLAAVNVTAMYGADGYSASSIYGDSRAKWFTGTLKANATATGTYVFTIPADQRNKVTVVVTYAGNAPTVAFEGAVR